MTLNFTFIFDFKTYLFALCWCAFRPRNSSWLVLVAFQRLFHSHFTTVQEEPFWDSGMGLLLI